MKEEKKITSQFDNDPIAKLRARELDLQAQENQRNLLEGRMSTNTLTLVPTQKMAIVTLFVLFQNEYND